MDSIDVQLRIAAIEDAEFLLRVRNSKGFAQHFLKTEKISPDEHREWLQGALSDSNKLIYIISLNHLSVGYIRLNLIKTFQSDLMNYEISIGLDPEFQNRNIGSTALKIALILFEKIRPCRIIAQVHKKNINSLKLFENANFRYSDKLLGGPSNFLELHYNMK